MGELNRDGESRLFTPHDLAMNQRAQSMQARHEMPVLPRADDSHAGRSP